MSQVTYLPLRLFTLKQMHYQVNKLICLFNEWIEIGMCTSAEDSISSVRDNFLYFNPLKEDIAYTSNEQSFTSAQGVKIFTNN